MNEQQKARIVELARVCELELRLAAITNDRQSRMARHFSSVASVEAFRIAKEAASNG